MFKSIVSLWRTFYISSEVVAVFSLYFSSLLFPSSLYSA